MSILHVAHRDTTSGFKTIGVPVIATGAIVTLAAAVVYVAWRVRIRWTRQRSPPDTAALPVEQRGTIYLVYATDHEYHEAAVDMLREFLQICCNCTVLPDPEPVTDKPSITGGGTSQDITQAIKTMNSADIILVIHSELGYRLYHDAQTEHSQLVYKHISDNDIYVSCMRNISQKYRMVSVHFDYTPPCYVIKEPFTGALFQISQHINALNAHIGNQFSSKEIQVDTTAVDNYGEVIERLNRRIAESRQFQQSKPNWFEERYGCPHDHSSGKDSGVVLPKLLLKNNHSHSCQFHKDIAIPGQGQSDTNITEMDFISHGLRLQYQRCDTNFDPPESDVEEQTSSLLDEGLAAINERYDYIVNNRLGSEDDCITVTQGNSV